LSAMVITIVFCLIIIYQGILAFWSFDWSHTKNCVSNSSYVACLFTISHNFC
jgi:hypothetical protein